MSNSFVSISFLHPRTLASLCVCLGMLIMLAIISPVLAADGALTALPESQWIVQASDGDRVELTPVSGVLSISYNITIDSEHSVGHRSFKQRSFYLKLKQPVPIQGNQARVMFEALGQSLQTQSGRSQSQAGFRPVIEDASGELISYTPKPFPHLKNNSPNWGLWSSSSFYTSEAGGATQDVFEAEGGDQNAWPDGALKFWGFRVDVRLPAFGNATGQLLLGDMRLAPERFDYADPFVYLDGLLTQAGNYQITATIRNRFQGPALRETLQAVTFDPKDHASRRQRLTFELGGDDHYWIDYAVRDAAGKIVAVDSFRRHVWGRTGATPTFTPVDASKAPVAGHLRVAPNQVFDRSQGVGGVFEIGQPMKLSVRVFARNKTDLKLAWKTLQVQFPATIASGELPVTATGEAFEDLSLNIPDETGRDVYRLQLSLLSAGNEIDRVEWVVGRKTDFSKPYGNRTGRFQDRNSVKESTYQRTTYIQPVHIKIKSEDEALALFAKIAADATRTAPYMTYMIDLRDFEVLPGVYDFPLLDRIMDAAADRACSLTIRLAHTDGQGLYRWQRYTKQFSQDGLPVILQPYGAYAQTDETMTNDWHRAYRAFYDRYRTHPGFQGFYMMKPGGEWTVVDQPWEGVVAGYEPSTRIAFVDYMRKQVSDDLTKLNTRWNTNYKTWNEVDVPQPRFDTGTKPDLRMHWLDFCRFKTWLDEEAWFPPAARRIREYAPDHVIIAYDVIDPELNKGTIDYYHNGGNHHLKWEGRMVEDWHKYRTGWITEPIHPHRWANNGDPAERGWVLDWSTWIMLAQASGGGANLHIYYMPQPMELVAKYGGAFSYDRFEKFQTIMREMQQITLIDEPRKIATLYDRSTLYAKHRTTFSARIDDLTRWFELLKFDSVRYESLKPERLSQYKVVLPNALDQVMTRSNIQLLNTAVREHGAKLIINALNGQYCAEEPDREFALLSELGITPPKGPYVRNKPSVTAQVVASNPLFDNGSSLKFFSQIDQQRVLQSPQVKVSQQFWQWTFRFIPQTDYFGYYPNQSPANCEVLARFDDGGAAVTRHVVGKGEVILFWGMPEYTTANYQGMMARAEAWAGIDNPLRGSAIPFLLEGKNESLGRFYAALYHEKPGVYSVKFPHAPEGEYFLDDIVSDQRLGTYRGTELRNGTLNLTWVDGYSPLKIIRLIPKTKMQAEWIKKYRTPE